MGSLDEPASESAQPSTSPQDRSPFSDSSGSSEPPPMVASDSSESDQAHEFSEPAQEEESGALAQSGYNQDGIGDSANVERVPENIVVAKVEPSGHGEEQLARLKAEEMATAASGLEDVFFEFDSWKITEEARGVLEQNAVRLQSEAELNLLIEGHCDQRGTQAYNIVLGKKRAMAIRDYLVQPWDRTDQTRRGDVWKRKTFLR